jgi:hypothetical protein
MGNQATKEAPQYFGDLSADFRVLSHKKRLVNLELTRRF